MDSFEFESVPFAPDGGYASEADAEVWESERRRGRAAARGGSTGRRNPTRSGSKAGSRPPPRPRPKPPSRNNTRRPRSRYMAPAPPCVCPVHGTEYVRWVQSALNQVESANLPVNGVMSAATRNALRRFQSSKGLPVDGIAGPEVEQALRDARGSGNAGAPADEPARDQDQGELYEAEEAYEFETLELEAPTSRPTLRRGSRGSAVVDLQRRLGSAGFNAGAADGIFGSNTDAAVRGFQRSRGLGVDGIVGSRTWGALLGTTPGTPSVPGGGGGGSSTANEWVLPASVRAAGDAQTVRYDSPPPWIGMPGNCTGTFTAGAAALKRHIMAAFAGVSSIGGYSCRANSANRSETSVHGTGRALDIMIRTVGGKANSAVGDPIANWLVRNASAIGVQYVIWNRMRWSGHRSPRVARYTGPSPHIDHVHVELNEDGAARRTSWFQAPAGSHETELEAVEVMDEEIGFDSPTRKPRPVRATFVSCNKPSAAFAAITGPDPVGTIGRANTRAIALLDRAINALQNPRERIRRGARAAAPTVSAQVSSALRGRFGLDASVRSLWTGTGARSVLVLIRRLRGARQILADGWMKYTCLGAGTVKLGNCAGPGCPPDAPARRAVSCGGHSRIVLCTAWWSDNTADQATTLLHECFHIYFGFIRDSGKFGNAHCYEHFVLNLNGLRPQAGFEGQCP